MAEILIVPARRAHAEVLAASMREADRAEVLAAGGYSPLDALLVSLEHTPDARCALIEGAPAAIYGAAQTPQPKVGVVWCLTSTVVDRHKRTFAQAAPAEVERIQDQYPLLTNAVDARYESALRWLARLGFRIMPPQPFGKAGLPFHRIWRYRDV